MSIAEAVLLGVVQGLTEFLPVSSSAHLVLVPAVLGMDDPPLSFLVLLHAATLIALIAYFRRELIELGLTLRESRSRKVVGLLALGTVPAAVIGFVFEERFERSFGKPFQVAIQLMATGVLLAGIEVLARRKQAEPGASGGPASTEQRDSVEELSEKLSPMGAVAVGFAQALSIIPGISRSGATIAAGMAAGMSRDLSARFSFLLAIPILAGTSIFKAPDLAGAGVSAGAMVAGFVASLVSGYIAIWATIGYLRRRGLLPFAAYCLIAGGALALFL